MICARIVSSSLWKAASIVALYVPYGSEVDLRALVALGEREGKRVAIPRCTSDAHMVFDEVRTGDLERLVPGRFAIPVAAVQHDIALDATTLVLVPCLGVAASGHRIGSGRGFYDRALAKGASRAATVAFSIQLSDLPVEVHDVATDAVVTEEGWLTASAQTGDSAPSVAATMSVADRDNAAPDTTA